ncbi:WD40 repeat-like protein [Paxillus ammoniavirescens]|nr:WD40 repeat-like protein [Paxillus ammoniavirescens]
MLTSSRSVSSEMTNVPPVVMSSSRSVASKNVSDPVPVQVLEGHEGLVNCVRFCLDDDKLVTGSSDNALRIWNRTTGAVEVLRGHSGPVWDVDVSRDGKTIVSGSRDKTVRIWNRESGETMHVCEGHKYEVWSVQLSPDSRRVVSGSDDETVRVWLVETGELAFEPIKCYGWVCCVRYSPSGDRIASGADSVQIWNAETGSGIVSIRNSMVTSLAWTADGTYVIGGRAKGEVAIWNSHTGEQLRTWKVHDDKYHVTFSLSPSGSHLATFAWHDSTAFVFDVSTGGPILALEHNENVQGIAYSPSGNFIATGSEDGKVYLWEAPVVEHPPAESSAPPFSSLLDRPAVPRAGPSRNSIRELDAFWDTLPNRNQQAPPQLEPQPVFDKVRNTLTNIFTRRPAGATQAIPQSPVRETVEPVEVAAGRDNTFWIVVLIPTYNAVEKILYTLIHCRKPEDPDEDLPATAGANSSQTAADNAATSNQSGRPETGDGAENTPTAGDLVIRTQPQRSPAMALSRENPGAESHSSEAPGCNSQIRNQPESIEMVTIPETSTVLPHASPQPTPSTDPLSSAVKSHDPSSTSVVVASAPLSVSSNTSHSPSARSPSHDADDLVTVTVSRAEWANLQDVRRRGQATSTFVTRAADSPTGPEHDHDSAVYPSTSLRGSPAHVTRNTPPIHRPSSQPSPHLHVHPSRSLVGLDPLLHVVPSLLSPSPLSAPLHHSHLLHPPLTANVQSLGLHLTAPSEDPRTEAPSDSAAQLAMHRGAIDDEVD